MIYQENIFVNDGYNEVILIVNAWLFAD